MFQCTVPAALDDSRESGEGALKFSLSLQTPEAGGVSVVTVMKLLDNSQLQEMPLFFIFLTKCHLS